MKTIIFSYPIIVLMLQGNTKKNADGTFTCQHGVDECTSDVFELCTLYKLSGNMTSIETGDTSMAAWGFIQCMELNEGSPSKAESCFLSTMQGSGLSWSTVTDCSATQSSDVQNEGAVATPTHSYVPWVLVDGVLLDNTNLLLPTICKDYTGMIVQHTLYLFFLFIFVFLLLMQDQSLPLAE